MDGLLMQRWQILPAGVEAPKIAFYVPFFEP